MIEYNAALNCARLYKNNIKICTEYECAYVFSGENDIFDYYIGGAENAPVVVWKKSGRITKLPELYINGSGKMLREFEVDYG